MHTFLDWICFNLLIGNNDSHSKNISLLLNDDKIELAPLYDLLSTVIYPKLKKDFSYTIGNRNNFAQIGKNQFELLDQELGIKTGTMAERMQIVHDKVLLSKDEIANRVTDENKGIKIAKRIAEEIKNRSKSLKFHKVVS